MKNNYRIMVVDDEHIVREAISSSIPWEKYQVEVVYAAAMRSMRWNILRTMKWI